MKQRANYDIVIIGGGPAGMSAALWSADLGLTSILIESNSELGGQLGSIFNRIDNYLGVKAANGAEMRERFLRSLEKARFDLLTEKKVAAADLTNRSVVLEDGSRVSGGAIIIATGVSRRKLDVPGEREFVGKGILSSGAKEAQSVRGKNVVIVGGGDAALENALILSEFANFVTVVHRRDSFKARNEFVETAERLENVRLLTDRVVERFNGESVLRSVSVQSLLDNSTTDLPCETALIRIGVQPNSELFSEQLDLDNEGYIQIDSQCLTSMKDVYAIGDVANPLSLNIATATGNAATAITHIFHRRNNRETNPKI